MTILINILPWALCDIEMLNLVAAVEGGGEGEGMEKRAGEERCNSQD